MRLLIEHHTRYRYREPVALEPQRLMLMPHEGHAVSVVNFELECTPTAEVSWLHDVFGNSVAIARFDAPTKSLQVSSRALIEHRNRHSPPIPLIEGARRLPILYPQSERPDLAVDVNMRHPEDEAALKAWAQEITDISGSETQVALAAINSAIRDQFEYRIRLEPGIQKPAETLRLKSGTCRDFALMMMETARSLGLAARFVSGYLYDSASDPNLHGAGHTHAWVQIYLPGPGWVEYDPTNAIVAGSNLLRAAVARDPSQAIPVQGTYRGPPDATVEMEVAVKVAAVD